jgi:hypothetical protein
MSTWTLVETSLFAATGAWRFRFSLYRSSDASPGSAQAIMNFAGQTQVGCTWWVFEFPDTDTTVDDGVVQSNHNEGSGSALTVTLDAFSSAANATYGTFASVFAGSHAPGAGFVEIYDNGGVDGAGSSAEFRIAPPFVPGTVNATMAGSQELGGIAVELAATPIVPPASDTETYGPLVISTSSGSIVLPFVMLDIAYQSVYGYLTGTDIDEGNLSENKLDVKVTRNAVGGAVHTIMAMTFDFFSTLPFNYVSDWGGDVPSSVNQPPRGDTCRARLHMPILVDQPGAGTFEYNIVVTAQGSWNTLIYMSPTLLRMRFFEYKV